MLRILYKKESIQISAQGVSRFEGIVLQGHWRWIYN